MVESKGLFMVMQKFVSFRQLAICDSLFYSLPLFMTSNAEHSLHCVILENLDFLSLSLVYRSIILSFRLVANIMIISNQRT